MASKVAATLRKLATDCGPCRRGFCCGRCLCCMPEELRLLVKAAQREQSRRYRGG